jgi:hypothetical protein
MDQYIQALYQIVRKGSKTNSYKFALWRALARLAPHTPEQNPKISKQDETGFKGAIAHLAIWNRLLSADEIASICAAGANDLRDMAMYHSYA